MENKKSLSNVTFILGIVSWILLIRYNDSHIIESIMKLVKITNSWMIFLPILIMSVIGLTLGLISFKEKKSKWGLLFCISNIIYVIPQIINFVK